MGEPWAPRPIDLLRLAQNVAFIAGELRQWRMVRRKEVVGHAVPRFVGVAHGHGIDLPRTVFFHTPHVEADFQVVGELFFERSVYFLNAHYVILADI